MNTSRTLLTAVLAVLLTTSAVQSQQHNPLAKAELPERMSPDLIRNAITPERGMHAGSPAARLAVSAGDADSFGRPVRWLGVDQADIVFSSQCRGMGRPAPIPCVAIDPVNLSATFELRDIARFELPAGSTHSLLCHSQSPIVTIRYRNPTAAASTGHMDYYPWLTIENAVLDDPKLIDPYTGLPYGGKLEASMGANALHEEPLHPGQRITRRQRDSIACIGGFRSHRALVDTYGLSDEQARAFFRTPTTLRLNVSGDVRHVDAGSSMILGLRILGD